MEESNERSITLTINRSEEGAFMDLLNYMYTDTLKASSGADLLDMLMLAYTFEVTSCTTHCSKLLMKMDMSVESAILFIEIPSTVLVGQVVQSLKDEAKDHLLYCYTDMKVVEDREEALALALSAIEIVLGGKLKVGSEDDVYEFILRWGTAQYPKRRERRPVITELMSRFVHFPYLRISTLKEIHESPEFDTKKISVLILESLYMNAGYPYGEQRYRVPRAIDQRVRREYHEFPIKETQFGSCHVVYLNLGTQWYYEDEYGNGRYSQMFFLWGVNVEGEKGNFCLFLERMKGKNGTCTFDFGLEVQTFKDEIWELESIYKLENCSLSVGKPMGTSRLFGIPWNDLIKKQNYFVNGILHIRAQFTIKNSDPLG